MSDDAGMEIIGACLMEAEMLERVARAIRRRRDAQGVTITLSADFDRLCDALEATESMSVKEAYEFLREVGATVPMDSELKIWWLASARERLISAAYRQASSVDSAA